MRSVPRELSVRKKSKMIKILFYIPGLSEGGAEKVLRNLVNNMDLTQFDITVQTYEACDPDKYLVKGIHYRAIDRCKSRVGKKLFSLVYRLAAELRLAYSIWLKADYDIEVAYLETGATKVIAQSTNKNAVKVAWVHCDLSKKEGMTASVKKVCKQYRRFEHIVCVSKGVEDGFRRLYGMDFPTLVLSNVIDEDEVYQKAEAPVEWRVDPAEKQLLAVGRLTYQKNFAHLIHTCCRLRADGCQFHLTILGEGPEREELERQIRESGLESTVELKGFVSNPYPYMKRADIIVCSSRYEGSSTVVQEALILGKVVVTTPCCGMEELLGRSEYGVIAEDSDDGLYYGLKQLLSSESLLAKYQRSAKQKGSTLKGKLTVLEAEHLFQNVLQDNKRNS